MTEEYRNNYCKDCKRSIYGELPTCDINMENNGKYVGADDVCVLKISKSEDEK
ncbi:MAG: hypothetical protein K6D96_03910 [Acetatifactor sp.]|nr:hypothetical protein [Acetatifactor sp.]